MLKFLPRTERPAGNIKILYQACDIDRDPPQFNPDTGAIVDYGACAFCRYKRDVTNQNTWVTCVEKHSCDMARYPFILMGRPINREMQLEYPNEDGTWVDYEPTGIYRQIKINAQPLYVQFFMCYNGHAKCNASCWYHGWRLDKKINWRTCGQQHICHNDGSLYFLMAPTNDELYEEFLGVMPEPPITGDFNADFNDDFLI